jgi:hypothetical protein
MPYCDCEIAAFLPLEEFADTQLPIIKREEAVLT